MIAQAITRTVRHVAREWQISKIDDVYRRQEHRVKRATAAELCIFEDTISKMHGLQRLTAKSLARRLAPRAVILELYAERLEALVQAARNAYEPPTTEA